MKRALSSVSILILFASVSAIAAGASEFWIHVDLKHGDDSTVEVNLPFDGLSDHLPRLFDSRHCEIDIGSDGITPSELRRALETSVPGSEPSVATDRVAGHQEGDVLVVMVRDDHDTTIRMPVWLAEALLSGGSSELDLVAAVKAIRQHGGGDLAVRTEDGATARIWVDRSPER